MASKWTKMLLTVTDSVNAVQLITDTYSSVLLCRWDGLFWGGGGEWSVMN